MFTKYLKEYRNTGSYLTIISIYDGLFEIWTQRSKFFS